MRHRLLVSGFAIAVVLSSIPLYGAVKQEYIPSDVDEAEFEVRVTAPLGANIAAMDDVRVGRLLRALRKRRRLSQAQLAARARVSQSLVSLIERGHLASLSLRVVRAVFAAVDARFEGTVMWRGGAVDRLLDERHARLVGRFADRLAAWGWEVHVEVTFSEYGERGSIDILALHRSVGIALIV